jgi:hypothetical protein
VVRKWYSGGVENEMGVKDGNRTRKKVFFNTRGYQEGVYLLWECFGTVVSFCRPVVSSMA